MHSRGRDDPDRRTRRVVVASAIVVAVVALVAGAVTLRSLRTPDDSDGDHSRGATVDPTRSADPSPGDPARAQAPTIPLDPRGEWSRIDDPDRDGWSSEVFASAVSKRLARIADALTATAPAALGAEALADLVDDGFSSSDLVPTSLRTALDDGIFRVEVPAPADPGAAIDAASGAHSGADGLARALATLRARFAPNPASRAAFKVVAVERRDLEVETRQRLELSGASSVGFVDLTATWIARWSGTDSATDAAAPRLRSLALADFEIVTRRTPRPLLEDATAAVLGATASYREQLLRGLDHWLERLQDRRFFALLGTPGLAAGDVDGDGLDDLYVCQEGGLPNLLYLQNPDGSARDVSASSGADWLESSRSALIVDLDDDGRQDIVVAALGFVVVAAGDGRGAFAIRTLLPTTEDTMSLSAADYDLDGDLDLYVCAYKADDLATDAGVLSIGASSTFVYHDANNAAPNILWRNDTPPPDPRSAAVAAADTRWTFAEVTALVGLDVHNRRFSFAAAWEDYDLDGDPDLYVANDFGRNCLYQNDRGPDGTVRFVDVAASSGTEDSASGMSVAWGDPDRDGLPDIHVSNMFSAAGSRITSQEQFKPDSGDDVRERLQRFARGNTLLGNLGDDTFADVSVAANVTMGRWAWGSAFVDLNGDGLEDIVSANGYITTDDPGDL